MKPIFNDPVVGAAFRSGPLLIVTTGAPLPSMCVRCGAPHSETIFKRYAWHHPALYFLIILGLLVYAIAAIIVQKKMELRLPLCSLHADRYRKNRSVAIALLVGALPAVFALSIWMPDSVGWWVLLCVVMLLTGTVMLGRTNPLQPKKITDTHGFFKGANEAFLVSLTEAPPNIKL